MTERRDPCRTAHVLLESMPSVMGYVTSEIRRQGPVENPVHFRLLRTLRERSRSLHELAELHSVRLPTMSRTVTVMETKGWLTRVRSQSDRRSVVVSLTEAGREALSAVEDLAVSRTCGLLDELPAEDLAALNQGLEALYAVVREQLAAG
ncbi:MAG: MarR family winged helix-turn-helix transcriptional regulator [Alkalispirochaetaceae bacterium]